MTAGISWRAVTTGPSMDALLGRRAVVTETIHPGKLGRARIDGDNWQVRTPHDDSLVERGKEVVVIAYDSIILTAELTLVLPDPSARAHVRVVVKSQ